MLIKIFFCKERKKNLIFKINFVLFFISKNAFILIKYIFIKCVLVIYELLYFNLVSLIIIDKVLFTLSEFSEFV